MEEIVKYESGWEIDWSRMQRSKQQVWGRNPHSPRASAKRWHWTDVGTLRNAGIEWRKIKDSWEVDWSKRKNIQNETHIWARNLASKQPSARRWHWTRGGTLRNAGIEWQYLHSGRYENGDGYVVRSRRSMSQEQIDLCDKYNLWNRKAAQQSVLEHRLVLAEILGGDAINGFAVRHINGDKADNRPENLILGTISENNADHKGAYLLASYWQARCAIAEGSSPRRKLLPPPESN